MLQTERLELRPLTKKNLFEMYFLRKEISKNKIFFKEHNLFTKRKHLNWFKDYFKKKILFTYIINLLNKLTI